MREYGIRAMTAGIAVVATIAITMILTVWQYSSEGHLVPGINLDDIGEFAGEERSLDGIDLVCTANVDEGILEDLGLLMDDEPATCTVSSVEFKAQTLWGLVVLGVGLGVLAGAAMLGKTRFRITGLVMLVGAVAFTLLGAAIGRGMFTLFGVMNEPMFRGVLCGLIAITAIGLIYTPKERTAPTATA